MIELRTGLPGNGKTLSIVQELSKLFERWEKHPEEARPVYVHNIKDLALPHSLLPIETVLDKNGQMTGQKIPLWDQVSEGALIIIDECQDLFPPRSSQSMAPAHVAWLNTHRHKGIDLQLSTQHPKLIDGSVRALVGKHRHYRRVFGMSRSIVYEWDGCSDSLAGMKNATTSHWSFPADAFKWYKSAEVHTKQRFKLPLWLGIPVVGLLLGIFFVPRAYSVLANGVRGKPVETKPSYAKQASSSASETSGKSGALAPVSATSQSDHPEAVSKPLSPVYVGCIANASRVVCLTSDGKTVDNPEGGREAVESAGKLVALNMNPSPSTLRSSPSPDDSRSITERPISPSLSRDGYGVLGKAGPGVRQPGQDGGVVSRGSI